MFAKLNPSDDVCTTIESAALQLACMGGQVELGPQTDQQGTRSFKASFWGQGLHWIHWLDVQQVRYHAFSASASLFVPWYI